MPARLYDAHCHLPETAVPASTRTNRISVINGTEPADWPTVLELARENPELIPAIGLHPWRVNTAPENWQFLFLKALEHDCPAVGEIGLDQRVEGNDLDHQKAAFRWQLAQATKRNLPVSIHCVQATGVLLETLRTQSLPARGIHLHAFTGSSETIRQLLERGAYFSFNQKQLSAASDKFNAAIRSIPPDKILIETDQPLNQADHLEAGYQTLADMLELQIDRLQTIIETNFNRYFGG